MSDLEMLPERVDRLEQKLDAFAQSVDKRFDDVTEALVEQRRYTAFAFTRLEERMTARLERIELKLDRVIDRPVRARRRRRK